MKKLLITVVALCLSLTVSAQNITIVHPNSPGSASDVAARAIAEAYKTNTGYIMTVESVGGGNQIPGVMAWKNKKEPAIMLTTSTLTVFNPAILKNLPYSDLDFLHITMVSTVTSAWVVRADSSYKTINDVVTNLPQSKKPFVAYANHTELINFEVVAQKFNLKPKVDVVKYRGVPEAVAGLLEGSVEIGVLSINPVLIGQIESGALRVLAHTNTGPMTIGGIQVDSAQKILGVEQFNGFNAISLPSSIDPALASKLKKNIMSAIDHPLVKKQISQQNGTVINQGSDHINSYINDFRNKIKNIDFK
jgi:tripartite-type tricarboxylate transporter receptor subunit TctC